MLNSVSYMLTQVRVYVIETIDWDMQRTTLCLNPFILSTCLIVDACTICEVVVTNWLAVSIDLSEIGQPKGT